MSDAFRDFSSRVSPAIHEAIDGKLSETGGGMTTGFIGMIAYLDDDGDTCWSMVGMPGLPLSTVAGLLVALNKVVDTQVTECFGPGTGS